MFDRYYNYTACIRCSSLDAIEQNITYLLEQEGNCHRLSHLPQLDCDLEQLHYPWGRIQNIGIVGLFVGSDGWTIIKTSPNTLLCRRAKGECRPRLSTLAMQLGCDAFHLMINDMVGNFLLEVDATGHTFISGHPGSEVPEVYQFYDEQLDALELLSQFSLLQVSQAIQAAMQVNEDPEWLEKEAQVSRLHLEGVDFELLPDWYDQTEFTKSYGQRLDEALERVVDGSHHYWFLKNLFYYIYAEKHSKVELALDPTYADEINPFTGEPYQEGEHELISQLTEIQLKTLKRLINKERPQLALEAEQTRLLYFQSSNDNWDYDIPMPSIKLDLSLSEDEDPF